MTAAALAASLPFADALGIAARQDQQPRCWYGADFPAESSWLSFDALFDRWRPVFKQQGDTDHELAVMHDAILQRAQQGDFEAAFATALIVQESQGNTCTVCGDKGASCGLMQVMGTGVPHDCAGAPHPCGNASIALQVQCGCVGCSGATGSNIVDCRARYGNVYGPTARCYNSGSVENPHDLRQMAFGDPRYVQNIANILLGADYDALLYYDANCGF